MESEHGNHFNGSGSSFIISCHNQLLLMLLVLSFMLAGAARGLVLSPVPCVLPLFISLPQHSMLSCSPPILLVFSSCPSLPSPSALHLIHACALSSFLLFPFSLSSLVYQLLTALAWQRTRRTHSVYWLCPSPLLAATPCPVHGSSMGTVYPRGVWSPWLGL